ncbi:hypothetical protein D915_002692 [Fasciola hepatica]|uniref:Uncharacterized protein n=1 Tax=Fasciola hepatica TaxID=6192 RepID=A0A4E0RGJ2_FASHE|nr:hypothetical protein D915_002692 [Fasciola hepatica]
MKFVNMLPPTALFIYLLITTADLAQAMDGFTSGEQCGNECGCGCSSHIVHNNRPNCGCGCQNNGGDGRCQRCGLQTNVITPMCFAKAAYETRKLVTYMENLSHGARFTKICKGLENLMNYAQIYAMLFNRNVNKFAGGKACCARPVLRINEAILSSLSNIARVAQTLDYNMRMTDTCSNCNEASTLVTKIAQTYIRLLGVVMSKVSRHMCIATRITADDPVMRYADEIAVMFLQLAPATADFLKSPCICSEPAYHKSISSFKEQLDNMARITNELDASRTTTLPSALSLVEHHLIGMTYETKLNTTDNQGGYRRMNVDNMDYAHEVATIFRKKDDMFRSVMDRFDFQSSMFEGTTSMMTKGDCTRKLTVDLQIMTEAAVSFVNKEFIKADKVPQDNFKKLIDVAQTATDYALNVIGLLQYDNAEDVTNDAGGIQNLKQQVSLSRVLKAVVETPSCSGMCMPAGHFANFRPLMRAMTGAGQKLSEVYGRGGAEVSLNAITDELIRVVKMTWDILYRKRVRSGEFFETAQVLFSNFLDSNRASDSQKVAKVKELISVERELLNTMTGVPHSLIAEDTQALEGMQQAFQRMLYNSELYGDSTKLKLSAIQSKVSSINSECHMALSAVVTHMLEIANILKPSS